MEQYKNIDSTMGAENHFKNGASFKSHTSMGNIKHIFGIWLCTIIAAFLLTNCDGNKKDEYDELTPYRDEKTGKWGYLNERGKKIISIKYDSADDFVEGLAKVKLNEKYGCINEKGKEIIPLMYERIEFLFDSLVKVKLDDKYGLFKKTGIEILPPKYTIIQKMNKEVFYSDIRAWTSNEWVFIDRDGNIRERSNSEGWIAFAVEGIIYEISRKTNNVSILEINGDNEVIIPDEVVFNGTNYKVTHMDRSLGCSDNITSITLPVSCIPSNLCNCKNLTTVTLPSSMESIPRGAFSNNVNLTSINIPESVEYIGDEAFMGCVNLKSINIPNKVKKIGYRAFSGCTNLTAIDFPESLIEISSSTFQFCTGLTEVNIPNKVKRIGPSAFSGCTNLTAINLPESLIEINSYAFRDCIELTEIIIPKSVKTIEAYAFYSCKNLISAFIPVTVTDFDNQAFANCPNLTLNSSALRRIWENTRRADRIREYNSFIRSYPHSEYVTIAQNRIEQLNTIKKATVELDCPSNVYFLSQATWNWSWTTRFTEKNDKAGYTLSSSTYTITKGNTIWYPPNGDKREITVNKGYGADTSTQLSGETMRGGIFKRVWNGTDEWGNPIEVVEKVILR